MSGDERRRWKRLKQQLRVQLQLVDPDSGTRTVHAIGTHMSPTGIFVQMADPPAIGTRVRVTIGAGSEGTDGVLTADGEVSAQNIQFDESERPPGCGVAFDETGAGWQKIYDLLSEA
jgi:hypothetical protein